MQLRCGLALCAALLAMRAVSTAQDSSQTAHAAAAPNTASSAARVPSTIPVYKLGKDITAPVVIPMDYSAHLAPTVNEQSTSERI
jgi:hypothetical protein